MASFLKEVVCEGLDYQSLFKRDRTLYTHKDYRFLNEKL